MSSCRSMFPGGLAPRPEALVLSFLIATLAGRLR
jgi:hypothetical protein